MAAGVAINQVGFSWEGTDNRGNKVRGKTMASSEAAVRAYCENNLTGYKRPRVLEFRADRPKSPVGKILRRELRNKT